MMFIQRILWENLKQNSVFDFFLFMTKHLKCQSLGKILSPAVEVGFIWIIGQSRGLQGEFEMYFRSGMPSKDPPLALLSLYTLMPL